MREEMETKKGGEGRLTVPGHVPKDARDGLDFDGALCRLGAGARVDCRGRGAGHGACAACRGGPVQDAGGCCFSVAQALGLGYVICAVVLVGRQVSG